MEPIGNHAANIPENAVFMVFEKDIRHHLKTQSDTMDREEVFAYVRKWEAFGEAKRVALADMSPHCRLEQFWSLMKSEKSHGWAGRDSRKGDRIAQQRWLILKNIAVS